MQEQQWCLLSRVGTAGTVALGGRTLSIHCAGVGGSTGRIVRVSGRSGVGAGTFDVALVDLGRSDASHDQITTGIDHGTDVYELPRL